MELINKIQKKKVIVFLLVVSIIFIAGKVSADTYYLPEIYPEDYSFRSGLTLDTEIQNSVGEVLQKEVYYWGAKYPFRDPNEVSVQINPTQGGYQDKPIIENVGFRYSVSKLIPSKEARSGSLSASLALIPYLESKKTIVYDPKTGKLVDPLNPDGGAITPNSMGFGESFEYDKYGNIKIQTSYGTMLAETPKNFRKIFEGNRELFNPNCYGVCNPHDPYFTYQDPLTKDSSLTTLEGEIQVTDNKIFDNMKTEITYLYEEYPLYKSSPFYQIEQGPDSYTLIPDTKSIFGVYELMNFVDIVARSKTYDALGRLISNVEQFPSFYNGNYEECGTGLFGLTNPPMYEKQQLCFQFQTGSCYKDSEAAKVSVSTKEYDIEEDSCISGEPSSCVRKVAGLVTSYSELGEGFSELTSDITKQESFTYYDCGGVRSIITTQPYIDPNTDLEIGDLEVDYYPSSTYSSSVLLEYDQMGNPTKVEVFPNQMKDDSLFEVPKVEKTAKVKGYGYITESKDENGLVTEYDYDQLGRIKKVAISPDNLGSPTSEYWYEDYSTEEGTFLKIKERRKIDSKKYVISYHLYDGAGRHIQTQTAGEQDNEVILTLTKYDVLGRVTQEMKPISRLKSQISFGNLQDYNKGDSGIDFMKYEYDDLGRVTKIINFDNSEIKKEYTIESTGEYPDKYAVESVWNENGERRTFYSDSKGNLAFVELPSLI